MAYYVIGDDKGFEPSYTAAQIETLMNSVRSLANSAQSQANSAMGAASTALNTANVKQKAITSGTAAPSGGSNGDIYIQY